MILAPSDRHRAVGLAGRLRSPPLQAAHAAWLAARTAWHLPTPEQIEAALPEPDDFSLAAVIRGPGETGFQLVRVGAALVRRAGRPLLGEFVGAVAPAAGEDPIGGAAWAYGRCLATGTPSHEFGHFDVGEGAPLLFERLLLPLGRGALTTHILAGSVFAGVA
ncbi:hypothetical protein QWZ14_06825 [Paeniroseomonas aquatica]|uniref:Chorismate lyase n=1 Tax=Paeniroseomonas aquatica TaxID=373043 RepID=A0ABT8A401_9PROT|nr:hypothetical protein [Paeniroseomonas aquatica]MDN3564091.1 hypothetical protein [Paeniroseomonas aquatica]